MESGLLTESMFVMTGLTGDPSEESFALATVNRTSVDRTGTPSCHFAFGLM